jgi:hypothetical protein
MTKTQAERNRRDGWHPGSKAHPLWDELAAEAKQNGWILERALNPSAERTRGRFYFRDYFAQRVIHGAASLRHLRTWLMASPEQRLRTTTQQHETTE